MKAVFVSACFVCCVVVVCGRYVNDDDKYNSPIPINPPPVFGLPKHNFEEQVLDDVFQKPETRVSETENQDSRVDEIPIGTKEAEHNREENFHEE